MKTEKLHFKKVTGLILLLLLFIAGVGNSVFAQATVQTDKADYLPGELVIITGAGWMADETITLNIEHLVFTAHPAETWTTTASSPGLLFDASYIIDPWDLGETFLLTATGQTSGYVATTTFTDGDFLGTIEIGIQQGYFLQGEPGSVIFPILVTRSDDAGNGNFDVRVCITENFPDYFTYTFDSPGYLPDQGIIHFNTGQDEAEGTMTVIYDGATANPNDVWTFSIMGYVLPNNQNTNYNCSNPTNDNATGTFEGTLAFGLPPAITCPAPIVANTDAGLCSAIVSYEPIVIGDPAPVITYSMSGATNGTGSGTGSGIAFAKGTTTVTLTASNGIPPDATCSFAVTVEDHQAPSFTAPANTTIYTDGACLYNATVSVTGDVTNESDNCPGVLDATFSDVVADGTCQGSKVITRTWSLVDASGNAATTQDQIITVLDNIDPTFTAPANIEIFTDADCAYDASTAFTGDVIDEDDNCTTTLNATYSDVTVNGPCEGSHIITRTWSLVDDCGNAADDQIQIITVSDNIDPTFTAPANIEIFTDADCAYDASTAFTGDVIDEDDNCTTILEATFADAIIDGPCEGSHVITRTWSLVDDCGNAALDQVQVITVSDNTAPTFTVPADVEIFTDADCDFDASVNATGDVTDEDDNCTTILEATFADAIIDGPCEGSHVITRTWSLVDDCGNAALDQVQVITVSDNTAPTFTVPADIEIFTDADCDFDASVTATGDVTNEDDNCTTSLNATYSDVTENGPCEGSHIITRTWSLVDDCGNAALDQVQVITVSDNTAPTFTVPADIEIFTDADCDFDASVTATGDVTDEDDNCTSILEATFADAIVDGPCEGSHVITRTWSLVDDCGNAALDQVQVITVSDNTAPTFTVPADIVIFTDADCAYDASVTATGDVTDEDDNCTTILEATFADAIVDGPCEGSHVITRTWSLVDDCGNAALDQVQVITVSDNTAPTFTVPADIEIFTDADCDFDASVTATGDVTNEDDNCTTSLNATYSDVTENGPCEGSHIITRTWSLVDDCGNAAPDQDQIITVSDNIVPTFTAPDDIEIFTDENCAYDASPAETGDVTDEDDNCSTGLQAAYADVTANGPCEGSKIITRTWSLVDHCGNAAIPQVQIITVSDNIAPTFTAPADITIYTDENCEYDASPAETGDVTDEADNCSTGLEATYIDSDPLVGNCDLGYYLQITRTWSLVDNCGNAAEDQIQIITVLIPTTMEVFTSAVQARYYDNMTLYAEIANNCEDAGLTGIVEFFIDGNSVGTANAYPIPAGEEGYLENKLRATLLHQLVEMPGTYEVTALFTPDCGIYTISNGAAESDIIVLAREASPLAGSAGFYTGPLYSWTTGPNSSTATITMTAVIKDNNIPTGDVRGAIVTFYHIDNGVLSPIPSAQNLPVNLIDMTDGTVGAASAIVQFNIGNWNALDFEIAVGISGGYTNNPLDPESRATVTVSKPVQGGYIVGGGQIANTTSTNGLIKGALGDTYNTDYSFNVKYNKKGTNPQGAASITIFSWYDANGLLDDDIHIYHVKSNAIATLAVNKPGDPNAYFSAKATLKEELEGGVMVSIEGNNTLQLWMTDPGNDGIATGISTLGIQLNRKAGGIWFSSYWTGTTTTEQPIFAGSELMVAPASAVRSSEITVDPITEEVNAGELTVYPNPTNSNATFRFIPQTDSKATLEIFNMNGSAVQVLYEGNVIAGQTYEIKYQPGNRQAGMLLYRLILDEKVLNGKLMIQH